MNDNAVITLFPFDKYSKNSFIKRLQNMILISIFILLKDINGVKIKDVFQKYFSY